MGGTMPFLYQLVPHQETMVCSKVTEEPSTKGSFTGVWAGAGDPPGGTQGAHTTGSYYHLYT